MADKQQNDQKVDPKVQREAEELALAYGVPAAAEQHRNQENR